MGFHYTYAMPDTRLKCVNYPTQPRAFSTVLQKYVFEQLQLHTCYGKDLDSTNLICILTQKYKT